MILYIEKISFTPSKFDENSLASLKFKISSLTPLKFG